MTISQDGQTSEPVTYHGIPATVLDNPVNTIPLGHKVSHQPKKQRQVSIFSVSQREEINPSQKSTKGISLLTGNSADLQSETIVYYIPQHNVIDIPPQGKTEVLNGADYVNQDSSHHILNPGNDPMPFCQQFKDGAGKIVVTGKLNSYFEDYDKEVIKKVYDYFSQNITGANAKKHYLQTMRALLRKHSNKIAAHESRKRKSNASQKQEEELVQARKSLKEARTLTNALESQLQAAFTNRDHPVHNTLSQLKAVLENVPAD
ncbi:hypothetical protein [Kistimonas asteriae]|uniref:hypothetical protein n=1 Tax=Kistimonas asteriae TaxID=517724 RepID=UPI001BACF183|nr:hypothetical protein [Kistimonas asteriae]